MKWVALILFGGIGLAGFIAGLVWGAKRYPLLRHGERARGKVVSQREVVTTDRDENTRQMVTVTSYYPLVEFKTREGEKVTIQGTTGGVGSPEIETGTSVEVLYDPRNPSGALIGTFSQAWLGPLAIGGGGLIFLVMGVAAFFLIGQNDRAFGPEFFERMSRDRLVFDPQAIKFEARVAEVRPLSPDDRGKFVLVCKARPPWSTFEEEFISDFFPFDPGSAPLGKTVKVFVDSKDRTRYLVEMGPLLPEMMREQAGR